MFRLLTMVCSVFVPPAAAQRLEGSDISTSGTLLWLERQPWKRQNWKVQTAVHSAASSSWLSRFVEDIRVVVPVAGRAPNVDRLPDGRTTLIVRVIEEGRQGDVTVAG